MAGFDNDIMYANNADFSTAGAGQGFEANGLQTNGQLWIGRTAVNAGGTHISVGNLTSPDGSVTFGYTAPNITAIVAGGTSTVTKLTPDFDFDGTAAVPISPQAGNINVVSYNPAKATAATTFVTGTLNSTGLATGDLKVENRSWLTQFVVDPSTTIGERGTYSTIQSAIDAASSGDTVFIRSGTYTENITLKAGVNLAAFVCDAITPNVTITGKCTGTFTGTVTISGINLKTNSDFCVTSTGTNAANLFLTNCTITAQNNIAINCSNVNAAITVRNSRIQLNAAGVAVFSFSGGDHVFSFCDVSNSGATTTNSTISAGSVIIKQSQFQSGLTSSGTGEIRIEKVQFGTVRSPQNTTMLTVGGSGAHTVDGSAFYPGSATAISISQTLTITNSTIASSNTNAIDGSGTINHAGLNFTSSSKITTTTQVPLYEGPSIKIGSSNSGATNSITLTNDSNTASSNANIVATVGGTSAGDATHQAVVSGTTTWTWGLDNSDSDAWVLAQGTALGTNNVIRASTAGEITFPLQSCFYGQLATDTVNATGDGTTVSMGGGTAALTEIYDRNSDFTVGNGAGTAATYTAPVTGIVKLVFQVLLQQVIAAGQSQVNIVTSNRTYTYGNTGTSFTGNQPLATTVLADMDSADTATFSVSVGNMTKIVDIYGPNTSDCRTFVQGWLMG